MALWNLGVPRISFIDFMGREAASSSGSSSITEILLQDLAMKKAIAAIAFLHLPVEERHKTPTECTVTWVRTI